MKVQVTDGDIASIEADAIVTAINSDGLWFGGIDNVINRVAGIHFHKQAADALNEDPDVKVVVATGAHSDNLGDFRNVVFTVDSLDEDLTVVVKRGLDAAAEAGYRKVTLPAIRLGVMKNVAGTQAEKVQSMVNAINEHGQADSALDEVHVVIYNDGDLWQAFYNLLNP